MKQIQIKDNVFRMDGTCGGGESPLQIETDDRGEFRSLRTNFTMIGCEIQQVDGRWPIKIRQDSDGVLHVEIVNARIVAMKESAKERLES